MADEKDVVVEFLKSKSSSKSKFYFKDFTDLFPIRAPRSEEDPHQAGERRSSGILVFRLHHHVRPEGRWQAGPHRRRRQSFCLRLLNAPTATSVRLQRPLNSTPFSRNAATSVGISSFCPSPKSFRPAGISSPAASPAIITLRYRRLRPLNAAVRRIGRIPLSPLFFPAFLATASASHAPSTASPSPVMAPAPAAFFPGRDSTPYARCQTAKLRTDREIRPSPLSMKELLPTNMGASLSLQLFFVEKACRHQ